MTTTHGLSFEVADYFKVIGVDDGFNWQNFRIGTCHGLWCERDRCYRILAIENREPHNGHLEDVFEWFEASCRRDGFAFIVHEVGNPAMARILLRRGFFPVVGTKDFKWNP